MVVCEVFSVCVDPLYVVVCEVFGVCVDPLYVVVCEVFGVCVCVCGSTLRGCV